jgi:hypothetical protein
VRIERKRQSGTGARAEGNYLRLYWFEMKTSVADFKFVPGRNVGRKKGLWVMGPDR